MFGSFPFWENTLFLLNRRLHFYASFFYSVGMIHSYLPIFFHNFMCRIGAVRVICIVLNLNSAKRRRQPSSSILQYSIYFSAAFPYFCVNLRVGSCLVIPYLPLMFQNLLDPNALSRRAETVLRWIFYGCATSRSFLLTKLFRMLQCIYFYIP